MRSSNFDLNKVISVWRRGLKYKRSILPDDLDELEQHIRDQVSVLVAEGLSEEEAYRQTLREMGDDGTAEVEYRKVYWGKLKRRKQLLNECLYKLSMFNNYFKVAFRNLHRQKGYSFINILGLAVGLACFILIGLFVRFELSFDSFHENADRIYRVVQEIPEYYYLGTNKFAATPAPLVNALMEELPEVENAVQIEMNSILLQKENSLFSEVGVYATQHFFEVFSFELLRGNPATALIDPGSIILTTSLAQKYFGDDDPMGRTLSDGRDEITYTVSGIVADPPPNSHFKFDFLLSMTTSGNYRRLLEANQWGVSQYLTYVSLFPGSDLLAFRDKIVDLGRKYLQPVGNNQDNSGQTAIYYPQALTDIHLYSDLNNEVDTDGNITYVYLFSAIGLLILLIACINYMNLATARSVKRAKEVGVRKAIGARRIQIVVQFMGEAMILTITALGLAMGLAYLLLPSFNVLTAREMVLGFGDQSGFWITIIALSLGVGFLAGSYPALVISRFAPVSAMKGVKQQGAKKISLRNGLVIAQFAITTALILCTLAIYQQLDYIQMATTGIDRDQVVLIRVGDDTLMEHYDALKETLSQHPNVLDITASRQDPVEIGSRAEATSWEGAEGGQRISYYQMAVQPEFIEFFRIELVNGRDLSDSGTENAYTEILINETMAGQLGWDSAVGKSFNFQGQEMHVVGVMRDFNFRSFHETIAPLALYLGRDWPFSRVLVKVHPERLSETISHLEATMATFSPTSPFVYEFLDDVYNNMYRTEVRLSRLFSNFTVLALLIACLGLLGLATFITTQRTKEIGVRKVLGASSSDIFMLLSKDFLKYVVIGFVIAAPILYFAIQRWLEGFAYHIELSPTLFLFTGGLLVLVALFTVSYQSIKAALADPVKSLRYE